MFNDIVSMGVTKAIICASLTPLARKKEVLLREAARAEQRGESVAGLCMASSCLLPPVSYSLVAAAMRAQVALMKHFHCSAAEIRSVYNRAARQVEDWLEGIGSEWIQWESTGLEPPFLIVSSIFYSLSLSLSLPQRNSRHSGDG